MQQSDAGDFRAHICITPQSDLKIHAARGSAQLEERRMGKKCCRHSRRAVVFTAGGRCSCPGATLSWKHHRYGSVDDKCNMPRGFESKARIPLVSIESGLSWVSGRVCHLPVPKFSAASWTHTPFPQAYLWSRSMARSPRGAHPTEVEPALPRIRHWSNFIGPPTMLIPTEWRRR